MLWTIEVAGKEAQAAADDADGSAISEEHAGHAVCWWRRRS